MGNFIWIFIGTTTFVGLILFLGNLFMGEDISKKVVRKLVSFDNNLQVDLSAPGFKATWEDGMIKLRNIKIHSNSLNDVQYSFDIDTINMTFSLNKWLEGHGLIEDIDISGLAGEVNFPEDQEFVDNSFDDSYILNSFKLSDMHVMMNGKMFQKPFELNLFTCEMDRLRRPWLVYDFLNANALSGSFNGSLFTLHKRQNRYAHFAAMDDDETESNDPWKKITRVRIDQVDLSNIYTDESKLNWVSSGKAELIVDVMLPNEYSEGQNSLAVSGQTLWQKVKEEAKQLMNSKEERDAALKYVRSKIGKTETTVSPVPVPATTTTAPRDKKYVVMDFKVNMYDLKASYPRQLPYSTQTHAPYISDRDLRSLITFINDRKFGLGSASIIQSIDGTAGGDTDVSPFDEDNTFPPLKFRIVQNVQNFKYVDFPSLISLAVPDVDTSKLDEISLLSYKHTNQFVDSFMAEILSLLLLYKEETRLNLIRKYSQRSGMQIFFNNSAVGSLLLVGLGSFVI
ncbi:DEKNAAC105212 [Brettanomyces naardenensis]|uniref:DEKNAAC105212 n=1 Tax=Brettanomyces naardenensis TaxID=13370 RepID=A0A448YSX2_BRENA|nr:DEKNAAC105212 [Brettanomyces naardenensis]